MLAGRVEFVVAAGSVSFGGKFRAVLFVCNRGDLLIGFISL